MTFRRHARAPAQYHLVSHEFAVVLTKGARQRPESGIGRVTRRRPLPTFIKQLLHTIPRRGARVEKRRLRRSHFIRSLFGHMFPFEFRCKPGGRPARKGIRFIKANVGNRERGV